MKNFSALVAMAALAHTTNASIFDPNLIQMADTEDGYSYKKVYDASTDKTWGFDGDKCDLTNLDKNYKHDVLE